jgi:hypothetical protein
MLFLNAVRSNGAARAVDPQCVLCGPARTEICKKLYAWVRINHGKSERFCHVATPQDYGHIESYRAAQRFHIVRKAICNAYEFFDLWEASGIVRRFIGFTRESGCIRELATLAPTSTFSSQA